MYTLLYIYRKNKSKQKGRKRENQGEGCRRHLRQFLASLLFRLMSSPSATSPAAHHFDRLCQHSGRWKGGRLVTFWAMQSPPHRHTIASRSPLTRSHTSPRVREGRPPRPVQGDAIATPRNHLGTDRPANRSDRAAPRRSAILPASSSSPSLSPSFRW